MTQSRIINGSSVKKTSPQSSSQISCQGEYCSLIHTFEPNQYLVHNKLGIRGVIPRNEEESRDRAFSIVKCLFTKDELGDLEASGKLIHLRIPQEISQCVQRAVPKASILMSKMEHRFALWQLTKAEDLSSSSNFDTNCVPCGDKNQQQTDIERRNDVNYKDVPVCDMCFYVYRLLSHARCLLSDMYVSTPLGQAESDIFLLNEVRKQSYHSVTPKSMKRHSHSRWSIQSQIDQGKQSGCKEEDVYNRSKVEETIAPSSSSSTRNNSAKKKRKIKKIEQQGDVRLRNKNPDNIVNSFYMQRSNGIATQQKVSGSFCQFNEQTAFPYIVLGEPSILSNDVDNRSRQSQEIFYNLVICHDIFDTHERMEIFMSSFIKQNPRHQILLWNYPGQAYTTFASTQILNNDFHAKCFEYLLKHVGREGTNEFDTSKPFFLLGHGHGGTIACTFASNNAYIPGLKGICLINPLTFIDNHFASVMHDCRNVFSCSPEARPDLPLYFYSRFIFSQEYLQTVSTPLALNLYTAVNNPISVQGRVSLCNGVLKNTDMRQALREIRSPIISVHGKHSELVRPLHSLSFLEGRERCSTIREALDRRGIRKTLLIAIDGGYELLQEKKRTIIEFIEELLIGYHEGNNLHKLHQSSLKVIPTPKDKWIGVLKETSEGEDCQSKNKSCHDVSKSNISDNTVIKIKKSSSNKETENKTRKHHNLDSYHEATKEKLNVVLDPSDASFERQQNIVYKPGKGAIYPPPDENTKPKEYMSWRLKRNRKRLSRFQKSARIIQGALRVYMAKTMTSRLKIQRSAINIQRCFRGMIGRKIFKQRCKELWAAQLVQRAYRGSVGRKTSYYRRLSIQAQINIARVWRGHVDRQLVNRIVTHRNIAAINLQSLWRRCMAIDRAERVRRRKYGAITIQRIFRGHKGRIRANLERDKYVFSKSQTMGIELGRKMLLDHKLHATRLQSELSILDKERKSLDSKVDVISKEISNFQNQAKALEATMHQISMVEAQTRSDIAAQQGIRQKKAQLDHDFTRLLAKIADRKSQLKVIEEKTFSLDKNRARKVEKLRHLERKLVAILEAQENELSEIRRRQDEKIESIARTGVFPTRIEAGNVNVNVDNLERIALASHEKKQTAKLMDSTETMMKFGFMSMAMTYFTSMNMVGAMKNIATKEIDGIDSESLNNNLFNNVKYANVEELRVNRSEINLMKWDIDNVIDWLKTIHLVQYEDQFRDASIDGPFLCELTDNDLKDALGIEHVLHRKKIIFSINQLKSSTQKRDESYAQTQPSDMKATKSTNQNTNEVNNQHTIRNIDNPIDLHPVEIQEIQQMPKPSLEELSRWIRSQKDGKIKEALRHLPDTDFDESDVRVQFVEGIGTVYENSINEQIFHINKCDDHGNTLMHVAAQNGSMKIAMYLIIKGANPNHQNKQGQTPGHFAVSYQFFDFASWLFDPDGGKGNDMITNIYGLGPYDGLTDE